MPNPIRRIARLFTILGVAVLAVAGIVAAAVWFTTPRGSLTARIPGLSDAVDIGFDGDGVPRIHAASEMDAAAALGFVHARDRMFQMDLMRRAASGRLSEILGSATLPMDRMMRTLGLRNRAAADFAALPEETRNLLEAYARGVNAWIGQRGRFSGLEFLVLGAPEPWRPTDSLLWAKTMGMWLSMNWRQELARHALEGRVPQPLIDELWPRPDHVPPPDARNEVKSARYADLARDLLAVLPQFPAPYSQPDQASNEWAVDGSHTASGAPLLAGDPHLGFGYPAIWYLARIETPAGVRVGATAPGVPFLVLGHNGHIAWTFTTTGADVQDVFIETAAGPGEYQTPDGPKPYTVREERIAVRGQPDETITVRETRHGPVISDLPLIRNQFDKNGPVMAVEMGNLRPNDTAAAGLLALNRARSVAEAGKAAPLISSPVQNLLVADGKTIGLFVTGAVPIRRAGDGWAPVSGDGSHDWTGFASGEQLPHDVAPASGRLVNANEPVASPDFPVFMGLDEFGDWRARRIREMLARTDRHTPADFARMQTDAVSTFAQQILPTLLAVPLPEGLAARAQALLRGWDGAMAIAIPQPLIFNAWIDAFHALLMQRHGLAPFTGGPEEDFIAYVLSPAGAHWCAGDCAPLLRTALETAVRDLSARFGAEPGGWRWGDVHQAVFAHPVLRHIPVIGALATAMIAAPGDGTTVNQGGTNAALQSVHGAEFRGVYDLADLDRSLFMMAPGQSGHPLTRHAWDFLTRWRDGATITLGPTASVTTATIRLDP